MLEKQSPESGRPVTPRQPEGTELVQAFVVRHGSFFTLCGLLLAQLLLLSVQITRGSNVRLIKVWAAATLDPFERSLRGIADGATLSVHTAGTLWSAQEENVQLRTKLVTAETQIQQLSEQASETGQLRALLDLKSHLPFTSTAAEVIASNPGENSNAVFIDKGSDAGLAADMPVVTPAGVVGKIVAVFPHSAQVLLVTDPDSGVGTLLSGSHTQAVLKGNGQNLCKLAYVMNDVAVQTGETVLTSGLDRIYPRGLRVGTVTRVSDGNIYKNIVVQPAARLDRLDDVLVLSKPLVPEEEAQKQ